MYAMKSSREFAALEQQHAETIESVEQTLRTGEGDDFDLETYELMRDIVAEFEKAMVEVFSEYSACDGGGDAEFAELMERFSYLQGLESQFGARYATEGMSGW